MPTRRRGTSVLANNYRLTELQAAVALAQLGKLDSIVQRRRRWIAPLTEQLARITRVTPPQATEGCDPSWWFYLVRVDPKVLRGGAGAFAAALRAEGVPATVHYIGQPMYKYPLFVQHSALASADHPLKTHDYSLTRCPQAEAVLETCVMLPINESFDDQDLEKTVLAVRRSAELPLIS